MLSALNLLLNKGKAQTFFFKQKGEGCAPPRSLDPRLIYIVNSDTSSPAELFYQLFLLSIVQRTIDDN